MKIKRRYLIKLLKVDWEEGLWHQYVSTQGMVNENKYF